MNGPDFEAVWGALPIPALTLDRDAVVTAINPAAESFVSASERQVAGQELQAFTGAASRILDVVSQAARQRVSVVQYDVEFVWSDRMLRLATLQASPIGREVDEMLVLMNPRGLAEKMDRSLGSRAAARSVTGMAAMLAHEIRNPLAGIAGAAQLLSMHLDTADQELTALIEAETARIGDLVRRVESFGDLRPIERRPVNIHDVLNRAVIAAKAGFASHLRVMEDYDPSLPPTAGDADQLMQVFQNILKNAAEAVPPVGGTMTVRTAYRPGVRMTIPGARSTGLPLEILVIDNGRGIPADILEDIYDPFVSTKVNGSGLGLSLVSKVLADHGGVIECTSEAGRTEFRILLPVWDEPERTKESPWTAQS